ncbi:MAG: hypothetical protein ACKVS8_07695 [Phycisphaerales bacterium]
MAVKNVVVCAVLPFVAFAGTAAAQQFFGAPTNAQRWELRYRIERFSPSRVLLSDTFNTDAISYDTNVSVGRVDITNQARVGILPNSIGTANLGVSRLGGGGFGTFGFRMIFIDAPAIGPGGDHGHLERGLTGDGSAAGGEPNRGLFAPFRGAFPEWSPAAQGSNTDPANGRFTTYVVGLPTLYSIVGGRFLNFGDGPGGDPSDDNAPLPAGAGTGGPVGAATIDGAGLAGEFANYYKVSYFPSDSPDNTTPRAVVVAAVDQTARYLFRANGGGLVSSSRDYALPNADFTFFVPAPSCGVLLAACGLLAARRRRC